jgi:hypothetical protein
MTQPASPDPIQTLYDERARLPIGLRQLQTFMTALPDLDLQPKPSGPLREMGRDLGFLVASSTIAGIGGAVAAAGGLAALATIPALFFSLAAAGRLRRLTVGHMHEIGHGVGVDGWRERGWSRKTIRCGRLILAETCSAIALTVSAKHYFMAHAKHHKLGLLGTIYEPDGQELAKEGFVRGLKPGTFLRKLASKLLNPAWYLRKNADRLAMTLSEGPVIRRAAAAAGLSTLLGSLFLLPFAAWLYAIFLPWFIFYPAASFLQVVTEHPYGDTKGAVTLDEYAARTWDRLPWDAWPQSSQSSTSGLRAKAAWLARFLTIHLPSRLTVLDSTMIWHRWHHIAWPLGRAFDQWWNIPFSARDAWRDGILPKGWESNTLSGLPAALKRQRKHMESEE